MSAAGIAAHEVGHAILHQEGYAPMKMRQKMVPVANLGTNLGLWLTIGGIITGITQLATVGVILFGAAVAFTIVTLPVEFDASSRAKKVLVGQGLVTGEEARLRSGRATASQGDVILQKCGRRRGRGYGQGNSCPPSIPEPPPLSLYIRRSSTTKEIAACRTGGDDSQCASTPRRTILEAPMTIDMRSFSVLAVAIVTLCACSSTGPVEIVSEIDVDEEVSCTRSSTCLERGVAAKEQGRFDEALPDLVEACQRGSSQGCRHLGNIDLLGAMGEPDLERAEALYRWGCEEADDGQSCHFLGELYRLGLHAGEQFERARRYFSMACDLGEPAGCHDAAVVLIEDREADDEEREEALKAFDRACERGDSVGCVNLAYMKASGWGAVRDHDEAQQLFERECESGGEDFRPHRLSTLSRDADPGAYATAEFSPQVACEQLEVLVVGRHEDMIMAVMDAETDSLRRCYDDARPAGEDRVGKMLIETDVAMDSRGGLPQIVEDDLGLEEVRGCVEAMLSRYFDELSAEDTPYHVRWGISFVHPPEEESLEGKQEGYGGCDVQEVQLAVSEAFGDLQACGNEHIESHRDDPGAAVMLWEMGTSGQAQSVAMTTTVHNDGLSRCLDSVVASMQVSPFDGEPCPVEVPFVFSGGQELHFSVVGRR